MTQETTVGQEAAPQQAVGPIDFEGPAGYLAFRDALFRKKKKTGWRYVESPYPLTEAPIADTHAHLQLVSDAPLSLARCAVHGVDFICTIVDAVEDGDATYRMVDGWRGEALRILPDVFEATRAASASERAAASLEHEGMSADEWRSNRCPCAEVAIPRVRVVAGVHPHNASHWSAEMEESLKAMLADPRTCALGEVGLDYHYDFSARCPARRIPSPGADGARMRPAFGAAYARRARRRLRNPRAGGLARSGRVLALLQRRPRRAGPLDRPRLLCGLRRSGHVLAQRRPASVGEDVPEDRLLTETGAAYMAPVPFRGLGCAPEFTVFTAAYLAEVRGIEPGEGRAAFLRPARQRAAPARPRRHVAGDRPMATRAFCDRGRRFRGRGRASCASDLRCSALARGFVAL